MARSQPSLTVILTLPPATRLPLPAPELPARRGMLDGEGRVWLGDYPYAQDGLEIWRELEAYFGEYLALYYASPEDVAGDEELQAWWAEVKVRHQLLTWLVCRTRAAAGRQAGRRAWVLERGCRLRLACAGGGAPRPEAG